MAWGRVDISGLLQVNRQRQPLVSEFRAHNAGAHSAGRSHAPRGPVLVPASDVELPAPAFARMRIPDGRSSGWSALSLFSGGGGLDLGFLCEGVRTSHAYDLSAAAVASHRDNLPAAAAMADLSRFSPEHRCEILLAGAPCQGFSTAGKRVLDDPRNALLMRVADIALLTRPRLVIVENVPAALSGAHGRLWRAVEDRLRLNGYNVRRMELKGEESGLAQRRRRLFMLAWQGSDCIGMRPSAVPGLDLRECLGGVSDVADHHPEWPAPGGVDAAIALRIRPGQKLSNVRTSDNAVPTWEIPEVFGRTSSEERRILRLVSRLRRRERSRKFGDGDPVKVDRLSVAVDHDAAPLVAGLVARGFLRDMDGAVEFRHTYNGKYRRLSWSEASPTVDTHFGRAAMFLHPDQDRAPSHREAARIQGFPDSYRLPAARGGKYELIGNAVPPPMGARIAAFVREAILKA